MHKCLYVAKPEEEMLILENKHLSFFNVDYPLDIISILRGDGDTITNVCFKGFRKINFVNQDELSSSLKECISIAHQKEIARM